LNWNGNLLANTFPEETNNGLLRIKQYEKHIDSNTRIKIEEQIIRQVLLSVRTIIKIL
jgi:CRISPR/Cas system-associated endonuclease Cas1